MNFGHALEALKAGGRATRTGWNGKGMWIALQPGYPAGVPANTNSARAFHVNEGDTIVIRPYLSMRTVDGEYVPWVASQTDILAEDWQTV
jgi:hypothetical protein